jgi:Mn-dependent DtxR family transcriptional regulator
VLLVICKQTEKEVKVLKIQESAENYLETILVLKNRKGEVRSIDIANELNFSKPSISNAMKQFREKGYIIVDETGYITLTDSGHEIAKNVYERHLMLTRFLMSLGVSEETAKEDACRIEHVISKESFNRIKEHYSNV